MYPPDQIYAAADFIKSDTQRWTEVIKAANSNPYGLAAAVWTRDVKKAHSVSRQLRAGTVWINTYGLMDASLPFGGYKSSGFGRELGVHAIEHYTELKTVWLNMG